VDFTKKLRDRVRRGEITTSIRIWMNPRVKPGNRYSCSDGIEIEVDSIEQIELQDITPRLARDSGFDGVVDLLKTAKHGHGSNVYLVRFHCVDAGKRKPLAPAKTNTRARQRKPSSAAQRARVLKIVARLPEATAVANKTHLSLEVRKKRFAYFLDNHHGDGRVALNCKSSPDISESLAQLAPNAFHVPKYVGSKGWVGLWLDVDGVDWSAVEFALREAYGLAAPKKLARDPVARAPKSRQE
jgi:predicted DNA-binding protein (MmcQ/YjbR family)